MILLVSDLGHKDKLVVFINFAIYYIYNDMEKLGHPDKQIGEYVDNISADTYVWYDAQWKHDDKEHQHLSFQLNYVTEGYQYFHIDKKIYLVPQNHIIWIPSAKPHKTTTESSSVNLMSVLFKEVPKGDFFRKTHVFPAPAVLKEMLLYASKWNRVIDIDMEQKLFLKALLYSLPNFCEESMALEIPVPSDERLIPLCNYINSNYKFSFDIHALAEMANLSVRTLQRVFKKETGITLQKYLQLVRILKSIELLDTRKYTLTEIAYKVGYQSLSAFSLSYSSLMKEGPKLKQ